MMDPVWNRPLYVAPVQGRSTWGVNEVHLGWNEAGGGLLVWKIQSGDIVFPIFHPEKTKMTVEKQVFEDVSPINYGVFPASHVSFQGCTI